MESFVVKHFFFSRSLAGKIRVTSIVGVNPRGYGLWMQGS